MPIERGISFNKDIVAEELPAQFRAPSLLPTYDNTIDPVEHIPILDVLAAHQEVLVSVFTQGLHGDSLFGSLAKKLTNEFLRMLAQAGKYMNMEDARVVKKTNRDERREKELSSSNRSPH
ncbi:UNVERIFIED_CONTAM: hypothetical protein Sindi_1258500 [Sesamum indicum]